LAPCCAIIRSDGGSTAHELTTDCASRHCPWYVINELQNSQTKAFCAREKFRFAHGPNLHQTSTIKHQTLLAKNGLCCFSSPTVVIGPCPGEMIVSSGNVRIFSRLFCKASRYDTLPPPIEPAKSESPTMATGRASPLTTYVIPPRE